MGMFPSSIISRLNSLIAKFLWTGCLQRNKIHLVCWQRLCAPWRAGGWDIKDIALFNVAILLKTGWRALTVPGLWHYILRAKYWKEDSVEEWIRYGHKDKVSGSLFWRSFNKQFFRIKNWLAWQLGSGHKALIEIDPVAGCKSEYYLPLHIIRWIHSQDIWYFHQIRSGRVEDYDCGYWLDSNMIGITGADAYIWDHYVAELERNGIRLRDIEDSLVWDRGTSGLITAKEIYRSAINEIRPTTGIWWHLYIWRWNAPLKIICFLWLALSGSILTWEALGKRGYIGPNICILCMNAAETVDHLFCHCTFSKQVWSLLKFHYGFHDDWGGDSLDICLHKWQASHDTYKTLPIFFIWVMWKYRNSIIFENCRLPLNAIMCWIIRLYSHYPYDSVRRKYVGIHQPPPIPMGIVGTFDGAAQGGNCGGGGTLTVANNHHFHYWLGMGSGTNTKAELVALWALLRLARELNIDHISILGDSMAIIGWAKKVHLIRNNKLQGWLNRTADIMYTFQQLNFQHHHREHNTTADRLSKRGLRSNEGHIIIEEFVEGCKVSSRSIRYY